MYRRLDNEFFTFQSFRVRNESGITIAGSVPASARVFVEIGLRIKKLHAAFSAGYAISNEAGETVYWSQTTDACDDTASQTI